MLPGPLAPAPLAATCARCAGGMCATLRDLARRAADDAVRSGKAMELEPMSSAERKVVHLALAEREDVDTSSEGREPVRFVVIRPIRD